MSFEMAVSVTGPRAVNQLGGPVIPGTIRVGHSRDSRLPSVAILS